MIEETELDGAIRTREGMFSLPGCQSREEAERRVRARWSIPDDIPVRVACCGDRPLNRGFLPAPTWYQRDEPARYWYAHAG